MGYNAGMREGIPGPRPFHATSSQAIGHRCPDLATKRRLSGIPLWVLWLSIAIPHWVSASLDDSKEKTPVIPIDAITVVTLERPRWVTAAISSTTARSPSWWIRSGTLTAS